jgi:hypothetical protein
MVSQAHKAKDCIQLEGLNTPRRPPNLGSNQSDHVNMHKATKYISRPTLQCFKHNSDAIPKNPKHDHHKTNYLGMFVDYPIRLTNY